MRGIFNKRKVVYADNITIEQRSRFYNEYNSIFAGVQNDAIYEFTKLGEKGRAALYPDNKRKARYYQDHAAYQQIVKTKMKDWTDNHAKKYDVEVYYE